MKNKKIQMAIIFYGNPEQLPVNEQQFEYLKKTLTDFTVKKYNFNAGEQNKLLTDFTKSKVDIVLKNSYGRKNEAMIEAWLELNQIPFLGSDSASTFIATSKLLSKTFFKLHNLPVAPDVFVNKIIWQNDNTVIIEKIKKRIDFPCIIKDSAGTDSRGLYIAKNLIEVKKILDQAVLKHNSIIVEKYIKDAYEATCFVIGNEKPYAFEPVGLKNNGMVVSGKQKDSMKFTTEIPSSLPQKMINKIKKFSILAHLSLGCSTFSRTDFLIKNGQIFILELDAHPGFRDKSATTSSANYEGQNLNELFLTLCKKYARTPTIC